MKKMFNQSKKILIIIFAVIIFIISAGFLYFNRSENKNSADLKLSDNPVALGPEAQTSDYSKLTIIGEIKMNEGENIPLTWTDDNSQENIIIKSDKKSYSSGGETDVYFSLTNTAETEQKTDIYFWFDGKDKTVEKVEKIVDGKISDSKFAVLDKFTLPEYEKRKSVKGYTVGSKFNDFIPAGETNYYKALVKYSPNDSKSEFFIEAFGRSVIMSAARQSQVKSQEDGTEPEIASSPSTASRNDKEAGIQKESKAISGSPIAPLRSATGLVEDDGNKIVASSSVIPASEPESSVKSAEQVSGSPGLAPLAPRMTEEDGYTSYGHLDPYLTSGLVGYWTFDGKDTNWATGKTNDVSGNGNHGTMVGLATSTSPVIGKIGQGMSFDGSGDWVNAGDNSVFWLSGHMTISAWIKEAIGSDTSYGAIVSKGRMTFYYVGLDSSLERVYFGFDVGGGGSPVYSSTNSIVEGEWVHVVATYDGSNSKIFLNGVNNVTTPKTGSPDSGGGYGLSIGRDPRQTTELFNGSIDDVRVYDRALSANEITQLYNSGAAKFAVSPKNALTDGLVGYWTFDGKDTNWATRTTNDVSGNGNHGTMVGLATSTSPVIGKIGQGMNFDGDEDYINVGSNGLLASEGTITAWVKPRTFTGSDANLIVGHYNSGNRIYLYQGFSNVFTLRLGSTAASATNATFVPDVWEQVALTWNAGNYVAYFGGTNAGSGSYEGLSSIGGLSIGTIPGFLQYSFDGFIDDVRIYDRVLSANEIGQLYNSGAAKFAVSPKNALTDGLVGYWTMDGKDTNWATRTTNDVSGNGNHGTMVGLATSTSPVMGKIGQGMSFDGTGDYVSAGDISYNNNFSISMWLRNPDNTGSFYEYFYSHGTGAVANNINIYYAESAAPVTDRLRTYIMDEDDSVGNWVDVLFSTVDTADGNWHHYILVVNSSGSTVYIDGINRGSGSAGGDAMNPSGNLYIGSRNDFDADRYYNGSIDDVRIYNRALSANEIGQLYNMGKSYFNK